MGRPQWRWLDERGPSASHHLLRAGASWGQTPAADVYIDGIGHVSRVGQAELEPGEGPDVGFTKRVDDFHANRQIPQSVHKAVRSAVASAQLWGAEVRGVDGSVAVLLLRRACCLCLKHSTVSARRVVRRRCFRLLAFLSPFETPLATTWVTIGQKLE